MNYKQREKELLDFFQNQETRTENTTTSQKSFTEVGGAGFNLVEKISQNGVAKKLQIYNNFMEGAENLLNKEPVKLFETYFGMPDYANLDLRVYNRAHIKKDTDVVFEANFQPYIKTKQNKEIAIEYIRSKHNNHNAAATVELWRVNNITTPYVGVYNPHYDILGGFGLGDSMLWNIDQNNQINNFHHDWEDGDGNSCKFGEEVVIPPPSQFLCWDNELRMSEFFKQDHNNKEVLFATLPKGISELFKVVDINDPNLVIPLYKVIVSPKNKTIDINVNKELFDSSLQNTIEMEYGRLKIKNSEEFITQIQKEIMCFIKYHFFAPSQENQKLVENIEAKKEEMSRTMTTYEQWDLLEKQIEDIKANQISNDFKTKISYITTPENFNKNHPLLRQNRHPINLVASDSKRAVYAIQDFINNVRGVNKNYFCWGRWLAFEPVIDLDTEKNKAKTKTIKR